MKAPCRRSGPEADLPCSAIDRIGWSQAIHARLLAGDASAIDELVTKLLPPLRSRLRRAFWRVTDEEISDATEDALLDYAARPAMFDPSRGIPLDRFLYQAGWRNVVDILRAESRRRDMERRYAREKVGLAAGQLADDDFERRWSDIDRMSDLLLDLARDQTERMALSLWIAGERRTAPLARALGLMGLPETDQRREVKRFKDRVIKRASRVRTPGRHR